jgi:hypothetical protein
VWRVLLFYICCVFCFCCDLLFAGNWVYFSFFMVVTMLNVDLTKILCYVVLVMEGMWAWQYMSGFMANEKLSSEIWERHYVIWLFFCLWFGKSWGFEMVVFRQLKFVREECLKIKEILWVEGTIILLRHFLLFCVGWRMSYRVGNIWRRWWIDKGFQKQLDCGICDGKERWCIFGTKYWLGV